MAHVVRGQMFQLLFDEAKLCRVLSFSDNTYIIYTTKTEHCIAP